MINEIIYNMSVPNTWKERTQMWQEVIARCGGHAERVFARKNNASCFFNVSTDQCALSRRNHIVAVVDGVVVDFTTNQKLFDSKSEYIKYLQKLNPTIEFRLERGGL